MHNLQPITLLPAREKVASVLRKAILSKELEEGTSITLEGIATQLDVSNTPVREAFQILAREGIIKLRPNKGAEILGIDLKFIKDHYETRAVLERAAAEAVCRNGADISEVVNAHKEARNALDLGDSKGYSNQNQAFHMAIWTACGNKKIKSLLSEMWNGLSMGHKVTEEAYAKISIAEHALILAAIEQRDGARAYQLMDAHIMRSMENILTRHID